MPLSGLAVLAVIVLTFLWSSLKVVREYDRLVVFRLGHLVGQRGPGLVLLIPFIDRGVVVSLRIVTLDVPEQEVITRDNITCRVNAVVYYRVVDAAKAIVSVEHYGIATAQLAQTTLRSVVGQAELDQLLGERDRLNQKIQTILDEATDAWGIKVTSVEIKHVVLADELKRAIARQAEAERNRRAMIINASGEREAAQELAEAADLLTGQEGALFLRTLRVLSEMAAQGGTIVFPLPVELMRLLGRAPLKEG